MIKAKITKNIMKRTNNSLGLSTRQIIVGCIGACAAIGLFFLLKDKLPLQMLLTIIFIFLAVVILFGCVDMQGQNLFQFFFKMFKGPDVRYYDSKGVFDNDISEKN